MPALCVLYLQILVTGLVSVKYLAYENARCMCTIQLGDINSLRIGLSSNSE